MQREPRLRVLLVVGFASSILWTNELADELVAAAASGNLATVEGLLNNAGSLEGACGATVDGFEVATQVNYLAPALLTRLLLPPPRLP